MTYENRLVLSGLGSSGGKGGSSGGTPREAPDSLKSRSYANILLAVSEGPIAGFVDPDIRKQIFLDKTPIVSASGNENFKDCFLEYRSGLPDQQPTNFNLGKIRYETPVEAGVKFNSPVVRTIVDNQAEFIIVRVRCPSLFSSDDKGNINPTSVTYRIEISTDNGPYQTVYEGAISGKTNSTYEESRAFALTPNVAGRWDVRITRLTADSTSIKLQNDLIWASLQVNRAEVKNFADVALLGIRINSGQFSSIPGLSAYLRGLILRVPHNYNSIARTYSGSFNGSLVPGWTNNPAWCLWAALTNTRWGCGIPESQLDVWSFYDAARYCDELVPAGGGTFEPRYTFNAYLNSAQDAWDLVNQIASSMRAQIWWNGSKAVLTQDRPTLPVRQYSPSNVVYEYDEQGRQTGGGFNYDCTDVTARHTSVIVKFINPQTWEEDSVLEEDQDLIAKWGFRQLEITAIGCTSRSQAQRIAKWELYTSTRQTDVCTFKVASEGLLANPGEVIYVSNPTESGETLSGRIVTATSNTVQIDFPIEFQSGLTYELLSVRSDGTLQTNTLASLSGDQSLLTLAGTFAEIPSPKTPWVLSKPGLLPEMWQVIRVTDEADGTFTIESVNYDPSKFDFIEKDIALLDRDTSNVNLLLDPPLSPTNLQVSESLMLDLNSTVFVKCQLIWGIPSDARAEKYQIEYKKSGEIDWTNAGYSNSTSIDLRDLAPGDYDFRVASVSTIGRLSEWSYRSAKLAGLSDPPSQVTGASISASKNNQGQLRWDLSPDLDVKFGGQVKIRHSPNLTGATWASSSEMLAVPGNATSAIVPLLAGTYLLKFADSEGRESQVATSVLTTGISILEQNLIATLTESPNFSGLKTKCRVENSLLQIAKKNDFVSADGIFSEAPGLFSGLNSDQIEVCPEATYEFSNIFDAGRTISARVWGDMEIFVQVGDETFSNRQGNFLEQSGFFAGGGDSSAGDATIQVSTSTDGITYTPWQTLIVGEYAFRYLKFRLLLQSFSPSATVFVNRLEVNVDVPDLSQSGQVTVPHSGSPLRVNFAQPFIAAPSSIPAIVSPLFEAESLTISGIDTTGFSIKVNYSSSVAPSTRTLNYFATSY